MEIRLHYRGEMLSGFSDATTHFADVMEDAEAAHVQVRGKYLLAKALLGVLRDARARLEADTVRRSGDDHEELGK